MRFLGNLLLLALVVATVWSAWTLAWSGEPEWCHWQATATLPAAEGLSAMNHGYLPSVAMLLRPFFWVPLPLGIALYLALGLFATAWLVRALASEFGVQVDAWTYVWLSGPCFAALHGNQIVAPMMACLVAGILALRRSQIGRAVGWVALGTVLKVLPIVVAPFLMLRRRWLEATLILVGAAGLSLVLGAFAFSPSESWSLHLAWPADLPKQNPIHLADTPAGEFAETVWLQDARDLNQSASASLARLEPLVGRGLARFLARALFWLTLPFTAWVCLQRRSRRHRQLFPWPELALWLAWIAFAAPFGRYYYSLLLLPAWLYMTSAGSRRDTRDGRFSLAMGAIAPLVVWAGPLPWVYAVVTGATWATLLLRLR